MSLNKLNDRIKWYWLVQAAAISIIVGAAISAALYFGAGRYASYFAILPLIMAVGSWYGIRRFQNWGFEVRDDHLYIEHGVIKKVYSMVPYVRVQHIDTDRGPIDRVLGLSTLRVYTAGSKGADIKVPGLNREEASRLQKKLRDSAINSEKGFDAV